jgi:hypothetical protein
VPHKTYEYLAAGRPILAAVPDGDARRLLEDSEAALLCRPSDVRAMIGHLEHDIDRWRAASAPRAPRRDVVDRCACDRLAGRLAEAYASLVPVAQRV